MSDILILKEHKTKVDEGLKAFEDHKEQLIKINLSSDATEAVKPILQKLDPQNTQTFNEAYDGLKKILSAKESIDKDWKRNEENLENDVKQNKGQSDWLDHLKKEFSKDLEMDSIQYIIFDKEFENDVQKGRVMFGLMKNAIKIQLTKMKYSSNTLQDMQDMYIENLASPVAKLAFKIKYHSDMYEATEKYSAVKKELELVGVGFSLRILERRAEFRSKVAELAFMEAHIKDYNQAISEFERMEGKITPELLNPNRQKDRLEELHKEFFGSLESSVAKLAFNKEYDANKRKGMDEYSAIVKDLKPKVNINLNKKDFHTLFTGRYEGLKSPVAKLAFMEEYAKDHNKAKTMFNEMENRIRGEWSKLKEFSDKSGFLESMRKRLVDSFESSVTAFRFSEKYKKAIKYGEDILEHLKLTNADKNTIKQDGLNALTNSSSVSRLAFLEKYEQEYSGIIKQLEQDSSNLSNSDLILLSQINSGANDQFSVASSSTDNNHETPFQKMLSEVSEEFADYISSLEKSKIVAPPFDQDAQLLENESPSRSTDNNEEIAFQKRLDEEAKEIEGFFPSLEGSKIVTLSSDQDALLPENVNSSQSTDKRIISGREVDLSPATLKKEIEQGLQSTPKEFHSNKWTYLKTRMPRVTYDITDVIRNNIADKMNIITGNTSSEEERIKAWGSLKIFLLSTGSGAIDRTKDYYDSIMQKIYAKE